MTARSDGPGSGSEFIVRIPALATEKVVRSQAKESESIVATAPRRILVADDNHDGAESLTYGFNLRVMKSGTVYDGLEALEVGKAFKPQIVLLDLGMPKMDRCEAARRMRESSSGKR